MQQKKYVLPIICGPTASGKTSCAINLAEKFDGEIISADSRQFFKGINIGTAKPSKAEQKNIPHHFIDFLALEEEYTAGKFEKEALECCNNIIQRNKLPILTGGSGMYIKALVEGLDALPSDTDLKEKLQSLYDEFGLEALQDRLKKADPEYFQKIDLNNPMRLMRAIEIAELSGKPIRKLRSAIPKERPFTPLYIGLDIPRETLYDQVNQRVDKMIAEGLVDEVRSVQKYKDSQALQTVGYKELFPYFEGEYDLEKAVDLVKRNTRRYAKRQLTWLRKNSEIKWFNYSDFQGIAQYVGSEIHG